MRFTAVSPLLRGRDVAAQAGGPPGGVAARLTFQAGRWIADGGVRSAGERADADAAAAYTVAARCSELGPAEAAVAGRRGARAEDGGASLHAPLLRLGPVDEPPREPLPKAPEAGVLRGGRATERASGAAHGRSEGDCVRPAAARHVSRRKLTAAGKRRRRRC